MGAIQSHSTATTDAAWDAGAMVANLPNDGGASVFRKAFAWVDPSADADTKSAYKFPNHMVSADGEIGAANMTAASAGIGSLNGARGGAKIPSDDRKGVYNHLARHLKDGGKEPPELKSYDQYLEILEAVNAVESVQRKSLSFKATKLSKKAGENGDPDQGLFSGYASAWTKDSTGDRIAPGAFAQSITDKRGSV